MKLLHFSGKGWIYFKLFILDFILSLLSLFLLYPWAAVREYKYLSSVTNLGGEPFRYNGSTLPYFKHFIKTYLVFILTTGLLFVSIWFTGTTLPAYMGILVVAFELMYLFLLLLFAPILIHGTLSYQMPLFQWRSTVFSWYGKISTCFPIVVQGSLLTFITLGFYYPWYEVRFMKYILQNLRFGSLKFDFSGNPKELFKIYLKGLILGILTLGIYNIWTYKRTYQFMANNIVVRKGEYTFHLSAQANTLEVFEMLVGNVLLVVCTLGLGSAFAYVRYLRFIINHCNIPESFNLELIEEQGTDSETIQVDKWNPIFVI